MNLVKPIDAVKGKAGSPNEYRDFDAVKWKQKTNLWRPTFALDLVG